MTSAPTLEATPFLSAAPTLEPTLPTAGAADDGNGTRRLLTDDRIERLLTEHEYSFGYGADDDDGDGVDDDYERWYMTWGDPRLNGTTACSVCEPGTAVNVTGSAACDACEFPLIAKGEGFMVCGPTSAGYGWASASSETACAAGRGDATPSMDSRAATPVPPPRRFATHGRDA